jgi:hypothetical protein
MPHPHISVMAFPPAGGPEIAVKAASALSAIKQSACKQRPRAGQGNSTYLHYKKLSCAKYAQVNARESVFMNTRLQSGIEKCSIFLFRGRVRTRPNNGFGVYKGQGPKKPVGRKGLQRKSRRTCEARPRNWSEKPAYSLPKGRLPEYNGRAFVYAGPRRFVLQAHGFAVWFPGPVFAALPQKMRYYEPVPK